MRDGDFGHYFTIKICKSKLANIAIKTRMMTYCVENKTINDLTHPLAKNVDVV